MKSETKRFIENNASSIAANDWEYTFRRARELGPDIVSDLFFVLNSAGVDILSTINYIPSFFYPMMLSASNSIHLKYLSIITPSWIKKINRYAICSVEITDFVVNPGCEELENEALSDSPTLKAIYLPKTIKRIGYAAFSMLNNPIIYYAGTNEEWNNIEKNIMWDSLVNSITVVYDSNYNYDDMKEMIG